MLLIFILSYVGLTLFTSKLHFHYPTMTETIAEFSFENIQQIDFQSQIREMSLFPNSFLENLHLHANVSSVYLSVTQGTMEELNAPQHGTIIIANDGVNQQIMISQLSEVFRIAKHFVTYDPTYFYRFDGKGSELEFLGFDQDGIKFNQVLFAQDPSDNICVDSIEYLLRYLGCQGQAGIGSMIDPNKLFRASYISVQAKFNYEDKIARQKLVILVRFPTQKLNTIFKMDIHTQIKSCPDFDQEIIRHSNRSEEFDLKQAQSMRMGQVAKRNEDEQMAPYQPLVQQSRFCGGEWFAFESFLHQQIKVRKEGFITIYMYFPKEFVPLYHTLNISNTELTKELIWEGDTKKIIITGQLKANENILVQVKFHKILKSFEEYPHDPERGHDLISTPVIFQTQDENVIFMTNHQVTRQPYPDFSMPFNILTFSSLVLGYYFLQILGMSVDKFVLNKPEKGSIAQRILRKLFSYVS